MLNKIHISYGLHRVINFRWTIRYRHVVGLSTASAPQIQWNTQWQWALHINNELHTRAYDKYQLHVSVSIHVHTQATDYNKASSAAFWSWDDNLVSAYSYPIHLHSLSIHSFTSWNIPVDCLTSRFVGDLVWRHNLSLALALGRLVATNHERFGPPIWRMK